MTGLNALSRCGHTCAHDPDGVLPTYIDVRAAFRHHIKDGVHKWCTPSCEKWNHRQTNMLVPVTVDDIKRFFREIVELLTRTGSRAPHQARVRFLAALRADPTWAPWLNAVDTLPRHPQSVFSDGHFCAHHGADWDVDILNERPFLPMVVGPGEPHPHFDVYNAQHGLDPYTPLAQQPLAHAFPPPPAPGVSDYPAAHPPPTGYVAAPLVQPGAPPPPPPAVSRRVPTPDEQPTTSPSVQPAPGSGAAKSPSPASLPPSQSRSPSVSQDLARLSVQGNLGQPDLPVHFIDSAKRTAFFPRHARAALPKSIVWGVWVSDKREDVWDRDVCERILREKTVMPYFTSMKVNLKDPLALSWDTYVRSVSFMRYFVCFRGEVDEELTDVYGLGNVDYYLDEWVRVRFYSNII